jgi:hypothetical protein
MAEVATARDITAEDTGVAGMIDERRWRSSHLALSSVVTRQRAARWLSDASAWPAVGFCA